MICVAYELYLNIDIAKNKIKKNRHHLEQKESNSRVHAPDSIFIKFKNSQTYWVLVAHTCNPSYSGGRDQEDQGLKPAWANNLQDPIWKMPNSKGLVE
jgi:hypothetical protein